jgi:hypothetical protein
MLRRAFGRSLLPLLALALATVASGVSIAQDDPALKPPLADEHAGWVERGVLKQVPPQPLDGETFSGPLALQDVVEGLKEIDYAPNFEAKSKTVYERAKEVTLRRSIWALEFDFKPVRMIEVDVPQPEGRMRRKLIWYLLYRVRNLGGHLEPKDQPGQTDDVRTRLAANQSTDAEKAAAQQELERYRVYEAAPVDQLPEQAFPQVMFFPSLVLKAHDREKEYLDRVIPSAVEAIAKRERVGRPIYDSVTISRQRIEVTTADKDNSVWGVATWEDVDPRIDFFSIFVQGLTNAYRFTDKAEAYQPGDKPGAGRSFTRKTLVLHFWRPGDTIQEHEKEIRYGMPIETEAAAQAAVNAKYGEEDRLDYRWTYR